MLGNALAQCAQLAYLRITLEALASDCLPFPFFFNVLSSLPSQPLRVLAVQLSPPSSDWWEFCSEILDMPILDDLLRRPAGRFAQLHHFHLDVYKSKALPPWAPPPKSPDEYGPGEVLPRLREAGLLRFMVVHSYYNTPSVHSSVKRPTLAFLWKSLPNQSVLVQLLCVLGIAEKPRKKHQWYHPQMELCECDDSTWTQARFQEYASLVQVLVIDPFVGTLDISTKLVHDTFWPKLLCLSSSIVSSPSIPTNSRSSLLSPNLERLFFNLSPWAPTRPVAFKEFRDLEVFSSDLAAIGALLIYIDTPHLQSLSLSKTHHNPGTADGTQLSKGLPAHLHTVATKWPALTAFQLHFNRPRAVLGRSTRRDGATAEPLAARHPPRTPPLPARAPHCRSVPLRSFRLCDDLARGRHHVGLGALVAFARGCPRLHTLHLPILKFDPTGDSDAASIAAVQQLEVEPLRAAGGGHWLRELAVRYIIYPGPRREGEVDGTAATAELLQDCTRKLFPSATLRLHARTE
ncbi:hypothetical protein GSI_11493 [Ganoderma sinense ZZ0214-1]|uniref:Uncharacterized protein n=1 Tax=Ganoderma sinense ZZ0214-1 TaxID=1077348 RepID=A0A2G8RW54_9APHY|nr:hypothetical protein GSI_11493 [Ganoderma sinense ZZ0214-1]